MTPDLTIYSNRSVGKRIAANTGLMVGAKALAVTFGLGTLLIATKALDPVLFGTVVFLHAYMLFFAEVATFQSWQSIIRFGTDDLKNDDTESLAKLIQFGIRIDLISVIFAYLASLALFGAAIWLAGKVPVLGPHEGLDIKLLQKYAALYCLVVFARQIGTSIGVFRLFDRFTILAIEALIMPVTRFAGSVYAAHAGWGIDGFLAVWFCASLASYICMIAMAIFELKKRGLLGMVFRAKLDFWHPRPGLWPFVIKSNIDSTLATGSMHLPMLMVMAIFGAAWAGVYKIAEEVAKLLSEGFKLLDQVIYPELAKLVANGEARKIWRIVTRAAVILLSFGFTVSLAMFFAGPDVLAKIFRQEYAEAAHLTSLLVPAAALLGIAAPLYPIFYAADKPERAIYVRGAALCVYIASFLIFSFTIGKMAPGWAVLTANIFAVVAVIYAARKTLKQTIKKEDKASMHETDDPAPRLVLTGSSDAKIWSMPLKTWQGRAFKKIGCAEELADQDHLSPRDIVTDIHWIMSANLRKAFAAQPSCALTSGGKVVAVHGRVDLCGKAAEDVDWAAEGLTPKIAADYDCYDKALRKTEPAYVLDTRVTPMADIMQRQFDSAYKGITDFVTKFVWPVPAFYATRFCAALKLTPNMVTTISLIMVFAALYFFWQGQWAMGFATGWFMTFLDTVDGKLARTTMTYSAWGNVYDHGIDLVHPPFWYWAWYVGLTGQVWGPVDGQDPLMIALLFIWAGYAVDRLIEGIFILLHGFHIHVWRPINSALRFITARRNPNMFIFMVGIMLISIWPDAGKWGFMTVAGWTWACIIFNIVVVIVSLFGKRPKVSWMESRV